MEAEVAATTVENVPAGQDVHLIAEPLDHEPAWQGSGAADCGGQKNPEGQGVGEEERSGQKYPAGHVSQLAKVLQLSVYEPEGQHLHDCDRWSRKEPSGQHEHPMQAQGLRF